MYNYFIFRSPHFPNHNHAPAPAPSTTPNGHVIGGDPVDTIEDMDFYTSCKRKCVQTFSFTRCIKRCQKEQIAYWYWLKETDRRRRFIYICIWIQVFNKVWYIFFTSPIQCLSSSPFLNEEGEIIKSKYMAFKIC